MASRSWSGPARGELRAPARVVASIRPDTVFVPFHWVGANRLTNDALDPASRMPEFKECARRRCWCRSPSRPEQPGSHGADAGALRGRERALRGLGVRPRRRGADRDRLPGPEQPRRDGAAGREDEERIDQAGVRPRLVPTQPATG